MNDRQGRTIETRNYRVGTPLVGLLGPPKNMKSDETADGEIGSPMLSNRIKTSMGDFGDRAG